MSYVADCPLWVGKIASFPDIRLPTSSSWTPSQDCAVDDDDDAAFTFTLPRFLGCGRPTAVRSSSGSSGSSPLTTPYRRYWAVVVFNSFGVDCDFLFQRLLPPHFWLGADYCGHGRITLRPPRFIFLHGDKDCVPRVANALDGGLRLWYQWLRQQMDSGATVEWITDDDAPLGESSSRLHPLGPASTYDAFAAFVRGRFAEFRPPLPITYGSHHTKAVFAFTHDPLVSVNGAVASSSCSNRNGMRVLIGTANLLCDDLERKGQMWYCQDFPAATATSGTTAQLDTVIRRHGFGIALSEYLTFALQSELPAVQRAGAEYAANLALAKSTTSVSTAGGYLPAFRALLPQIVACWYDYAAAAALVVPSFPGEHQATAAAARGGHADLLGRVLVREGFARTVVAAKLGRPYRGLWGAATALVLCEALATAQRKKGLAKEPAMATGLMPSVRETQRCQHTHRALVWQYSCQGALTEVFLQDLAQALSYPHPLLSDMGDPTEESTHRRRARSPAPDEPTTGATPKTSHRVGVTCVDVVIPTACEVRTAIDGWRGGISIWIQSRTMKPLIKHRLHRYTPRGAPDPTVALSEEMDSTQRALEEDGLPLPVSTNPPATHLYSRALPHIKTYLRVVRQTLPAPLTAGRPVDGWAEWVMPTSCNLARAGWGGPQEQGARLHIRSYEMGVVVHPALLPPVALTPSAPPSLSRLPASAAVEVFPPSAPRAAPFAPRAGKFVASFLTPDHPLHVPGRLDTAALEMLRTRFGLHAVALGAPSAVPDAPRRVVFLPYDPIHPQPYRGFQGGAQSQQQQEQQQQQQQQQQIGADGEPVHDMAWDVDYAHRGRDLLGRTFQEVMEVGSGRTYYGPTSWSAPVLEL